MNKICRIYISEIRTLFPIKRKSERKYLKNLASDIDAFCEEANITTKQELYQKYGTPPEVVGSYFSSLNTEQIVQKLRVSQAIKVTLAILLVLGIVATSTFCYVYYRGLKILAEQQIVVWESTIVQESIVEDGATSDEIIVEGDETIIVEEEIIVEEIIEE